MVIFRKAVVARIHRNKMFVLEKNLFFLSQQFSLQLPTQPYLGAKHPQIAPGMNMSTFFVMYERELAWFPWSPHTNLTCICMHTHWHTHAPTQQRKLKHSNPHQPGLYKSHIFRIYLRTMWLTVYPLEIQPNKEIYSLSRFLFYRRLCNHHLSSI